MAATSGPPHLRATVLGVDLLWRNPGPGYRQPVLEGMKLVHDAVLVHADAAMRRQKRDVILYWDAMTALQRGSFIPDSLAESQEYGLAVELVLTLAEGQVSDHALQELSTFKPIADARSHIDFFHGNQSLRSPQAYSRISPERITFDVHGRTKIQKPGPYRRLSLDMENLKGDASSIDWYRALLLALLVQLRCDMEVYLDTGFLRVRHCERKACSAFFHVSRMAGRQRFCSSTCRACAPREQK